MNVDLHALAAELGTADRTLRRSIEQGLLRIERPSPRKVSLPVKEREFLRRSWPLLSGLRLALRTEPSVSLAVLFGSAARGDAHEGSDVDVLVAFRPRADRRALAGRLSERFAKDVQLVALEDAREKPLLLAEVLGEGRVLVDRDRLWSGLQGERPKVERAAARERARVEREFVELFVA
ncbi:MAG: nucleotidyltransferase domain-containing protein [Gaiellaceae bacterium MAG52_C11]|nr:nucleotidyltransferase domain-containing protein [Candidatus Gaiellasilicea maunaloa]